MKMKKRYSVSCGVRQRDKQKQRRAFSAPSVCLDRWTMSRWILISSSSLHCTSNLSTLFVLTMMGSPPATSGSQLLKLLVCASLSLQSKAWVTGGPNKPSQAQTSPVQVNRRDILASVGFSALTFLAPPSFAEEATSALGDVEVVATGDAKKLFNEGRALESQGNMAAAQRLYGKVTKISPRFIYAWSNLGNTQVAMGDLKDADENYSKAIDLCQENRKSQVDQLGVRRCSDLYLLLLNRGTVRLNSGMPKEALADLQQASALREQPDAIILQNLARAKELNGLYFQADKDYTVAISMTANEVNPFWLRSAMVKFQNGDVKGGLDLLKRVENRFPEAPEVRAAYATFLAASGDQIAAQRKYLEIPDRARLKYVDNDYLTKVISWPPAMIEGVSKIASAVGDTKASQ